MKSLVIRAAVVAACGSAAMGHNHLTVDTAPVGAGSVAVIRAGYLPAESAFTIAGGRLMLGGRPAVYMMPDVLPSGGPLAGWHAGNDVLLTSDYFLATGRLDGGDFLFELAGVTPVSGGAGRMVWGGFDDAGGFLPVAESDAATRIGRSFAVGIGGHDHEQAYALTGGWVQDLTLVVWDRSGVYADSSPVTVRFDTGECPADIDREGGRTIDDIFLFLGLWFAGDARADFDGQNGRTIDDIFVFLQAWFAGCR